MNDYVYCFFIGGWIGWWLNAIIQYIRSKTNNKPQGVRYDLWQG
jgi:hypothetical protein